MISIPKLFVCFAVAAAVVLFAALVWEWLASMGLVW